MQHIELIMNIMIVKEKGDKMAGNKLWSLQEDELIDNTIINLPHRTDIEISAILFGHPLLKKRTSSGLLQHVEQRHSKLKKTKAKNKTKKVI
ncbi:hypothetical protein COJ85_11765 [Bacillus sp. AFS076308]|uniref:hypothetical protein n=1 Tax=unclassified Bacillus (in: firmicutes) TaxID=185979 RepID=UPI000BF409FA|nr:MULTISPECIES: hypothetical protein [unclassified Bacillus (in: firmicutes)]PFO04699.1 hypothetical protein COJ85_11765 [Bacillus sp. AFS076308]PGV55152.1 hypothetical protein COD92_02940 [Bacillus sp. AFS037270]